MHGQLPEFETRNPDRASNFLSACRGEAEANAPFSIGSPLNQMFNLGILAQRYGELRGLAAIRSTTGRS